MSEQCKAEMNSGSTAECEKLKGHVGYHADATQGAAWPNIVLKDISSGSRLEVSGVVSLWDVSTAVGILASHGATGDSPFHCYLNGTSFAIWTDAPDGGESDVPLRQAVPVP